MLDRVYPSSHLLALTSDCPDRVVIAVPHHGLRSSFDRGVGITEACGRSECSNTRKSQMIILVSHDIQVNDDNRIRNRWRLFRGVQRSLVGLLDAPRI